MAEDLFLLLGSNRGRRVRSLREGVERLSAALRVRSVSRMYASAPFGRIHQPWFLNLALRAETGLSPEELLRLVKRVEREGGRTAGARHGPRELDVDILLMGDRVVRGPSLEIPHPGIPGRRFCLVPLCEIAPGARVPPEGRTVRELLADCRDSGEVMPI